MNKVININNMLLICILILINIAGSYYFFRLDLTKEKKYSISNSTKKLLTDLDDIVYFKIYLHGEMPIEYRKLANETKYLLDELRIHSKYIEYEFIDPSSIKNEEYKLSLQEELYNKGITPIPERNYAKTKIEEFLIFPGIIASYKSKETHISLINETLMDNRDIVIQKSVEKLEYLLTNGIRKLQTYQKQKIGILDGHGETTDHLIHSFRKMASEHYQLIDLKINEQLTSLKDINCLIINNPKNYFTEKDKFVIDQFIMNGGKTIWILNGTNANMDSLEIQSKTVVLPYEARNLDDLLFKYGVRINFDLVQDLQAAPIPIITHYIEEKPQWNFFPWVFFPVLSSENTHIINTNINPIKTMFPSSIDLIKNDVQKTILLETSLHTKVNIAPSIVNLESLKTKPNEKDFNNGNKNIAVLLSGQFESLFKNRINPIISSNKNINFKNKSVHNEMIIISDSYFLNNQFFKGNPLPLGIDKHTGISYGNGDFILNALDYLLQNEVFIKIRSKNISNRLLNKAKIESEKTYWQIINLLVPLIILALSGFVIRTLRTRQYKP